MTTPSRKRRERLADEFFIRDWTVGFSRVEQHHAALDRGVEERDGVLSVRSGTVRPSQPHAAVPDRRHL